jgi:hypothetical protein
MASKKSLQKTFTVESNITHSHEKEDPTVVDSLNYVELKLNEDVKEGIPDLNDERSLILIISDLHLGADDTYTETKQNRDALVNFLKQVRYSSEVKELVIAGDGSFQCRLIHSMGKRNVIS